MGGLRWTRRSLAKIAEHLHTCGYKVSKTTVGKWLKSRNYSLRKNCKSISRVSPPGRKEQMDSIKNLMEYCRIHHIPMISVDTKKKELIGRFSNKGRILCKRPIEVNDHDFPSHAIGKAVPYGFMMYMLIVEASMSEIPVIHHNLPWSASHNGSGP